MKFNFSKIQDLIKKIQATWKSIAAIWREKSEGIGDTIAKITKTFGIKPCEGCERRRKSWNEKIAYRKSKKGNE
jgi:hypothetical protein